MSEYVHTWLNLVKLRSVNPFHSNKLLNTSPYSIYRILQQQCTMVVVAIEFNKPI